MLRDLAYHRPIGTNIVFVTTCPTSDRTANEATAAFDKSRRASLSLILHAMAALISVNIIYYNDYIFIEGSLAIETIRKRYLDSRGDDHMFFKGALQATTAGEPARTVLVFE